MEYHIEWSSSKNFLLLLNYIQKQVLTKKNLDLHSDYLFHPFEGDRGRLDEE